MQKTTSTTYVKTIIEFPIKKRKEIKQKNKINKMGSKVSKRHLQTMGFRVLNVL
jgi:hypothetical protein